MGLFSEARAFAPSKRVGSLLIVVVAATIAVIIFRSEPSAAGNERQLVRLSEARVPRITTEEKDSDGDGLKDWEEDLWGLSPMNSDTDGDGTNDFQEIENRRQAVADVPTIILDNIDPNAPPPSPTALAGQVLLTQFLTAKEAGISLPQNSIALAGELALQSANLERTYDTISVSDLNITTAPVSTKSYGNAVATALMNTSGAPAPNELFVFFSFVQSSDSAQFQEDMATVIERYDETIGKLKAVLVPTERATEHLALTNALIAVRTDLVDMAKVGSDALLAVTALEAYQADSSLMAGLFERLRTSLGASGAEFLSGEPGYTFIHAGDSQ